MLTYFLVMAFLVIIAGVLFLAVAVNYFEKLIWNWAFRKRGDK